MRATSGLFLTQTNAAPDQFAIAVHTVSPCDLSAREFQSLYRRIGRAMKSQLRTVPRKPRARLRLCVEKREAANAEWSKYDRREAVRPISTKRLV